MTKKIRIFAEKDALIQLSSNEDFTKGRTLKYILKNRAEIILIMDKDVLDTEWSDPESTLLKFCQSYDLPKPKVLPELKQIYKNPSLCFQKDPFALWLFNWPAKDINTFREYLGVWAIAPEELNDSYFYLNHSKGYDKNEEIKGTKGNGWGNFLEQVPKPMPPLNSIVLNDRYLVNNTNEKNAEQKGFYGLNNLRILLDDLLPYNLKIPFHLLIYCQHPKLSIKTTDSIIQQFVDDVKALRNYEIEIEFVYSVARHKRGLYSNYFLFDADRGFNAFNNFKRTRLCGENDFSIKGYMYDPENSGETAYQIARSKINKIKSACIDIFDNPIDKDKDDENVARVYTNCKEYFFNRLFHAP